MTARSLPLAICAACGAYGYDRQTLNEACGSRKQGSEPCGGHWLKRDRFTDWLSCHTCKGTGYFEAKRCPTCKNSGWVPAR